MAAAPQPVEEAAAAAHAAIGISLRHISLYLERAPLLQRSVGGGGAGAARHGLRILSDITGDVPAGSLFLIIGGSGSGKTSLLNALALRLGSVGYRLTGARWKATACRLCAPQRPPAASATRRRSGNGSRDQEAQLPWRDRLLRSFCACLLAPRLQRLSCASAHDGESAAGPRARDTPPKSPRSRPTSRCQLPCASN